jgi:cell division protein FtsB
MARRASGPGRWLVRIALASTLAAGVGYLPYKAYGPRGVPRVLRLQRDLWELEDKNRSLQEENIRLLDRAKSLKSDPEAIERVARDELGLARPEDVVFQFE